MFMSQTRLKRKLVTAILSLLLVLTLALPGSFALAEGEKVDIYVWHYHTAKAEENLTNIVNEYNAKPDGKANVILQTLSRDDLKTRLILGIASGELPEIAVVDNPDTAAFASTGMFMDITDKVSTLPNPNFLEGPFKSGQYDGKQYALPIRSNCLALWVNNSMFEAAGIDKIPETWDELLTVSGKLKESKPSVYPIAFSAPKNEQATFQFVPFLYSSGGSWENMGSPESIKALEFIRKLRDLEYCSADVINWSQNDVQKQFASQNAAMMIGGSWNIANMANDAPDLEYTIINIPKDIEYASCLGGENMAITIKGEEKFDAVWDFFSWFLSAENSIKYNKSDSTFSPNADVTKEDMYPDNPVMMAFMEQLSYGVARGPHPKWGEVSSAIQEAIQSTLAGLKDPATAGKDAGALIENIK